MTAGIDRARFASDLEAMTAIGWEGERGMRRTTFSPAHVEVRQWFLQRARDAGLETRIDAAGNHSAILPAADPGAPTLLLGSHLDSVPGGGRFDGALGVLCALEVLRAVADAGLELPVALEAIDFTDEEGTIVGTLGSWAMAGMLTPETLDNARGDRSLLETGLAALGSGEERLDEARRDPASLAGYLELHIEQGPVLERAGADIGIVTGIVGSLSYEIAFDGAGRHAGTTPMDARRDAGLGAAGLILAVREIVMREFPGCVGTVGGVSFSPGAFNVVPGRADMRLEVRSLGAAELDALDAMVRRLAAEQAERFSLEVSVRRAGRWEPALTDRRARAAIAAAAGELGLTAIEMPSGAGHDAQVLATLTPSGMVLVPSRDGISHHPEEWTDLGDCVNGARVLLAAALAMAMLWGCGGGP